MCGFWRISISSRLKRNTLESPVGGVLLVKSYDTACGKHYVHMDDKGTFCLANSNSNNIKKLHIKLCRITYSDKTIHFMPTFSFSSKLISTKLQINCMAQSAYGYRNTKKINVNLHTKSLMKGPEYIFIICCNSFFFGGWLYQWCFFVRMCLL